MKIRQLGAELFHADGQTDMKLIVALPILQTSLKCDGIQKTIMPWDEMSAIQPFQQRGFSHRRFDNTQLKITKHDRERDLQDAAYFK
jgi:hypothetical protein